MAVLSLVWIMRRSYYISMTRKIKAFTIVELLIVIVVIAVLASISVVAYSGIQDRARQSKVKADITQIIKAITIARGNRSQTTSQMSGSTATGGSCWGKASGTDIASLPLSDSCWVNYNNFMDIISTESGVNIRGMVDPWGRPYLVDENEGEGGSCARDTIAMFRLPHVTGYGIHPWTSNYNVRNSGFTGCSS